MYNKLLLLVLLAFSLNLSAFESVKQYKSVDLDSVLSNSSKSGKFTFSFPEMDLLNQKNQITPLNKIFDKDQNVVFAFFFTHCVSVCTTVTLSLKSIQSSLPKDTNIVMISIDPETDTPDILNRYADMHRIKNPNWQLLTGTNEQIVDLQKNFEAYRGNKMNHSTSIFVKRSNSSEIIEIKSNFSIIPQLFKENIKS